MDPDTFAPSNVIHLFVMESDLDLSVGVPGGAAAPEDDEEVGEFSDEELCDLLEGDDEEDPLAFPVLCLCVEKVGVISPWVGRISWGVGHKLGGGGL